MTTDRTVQPGGPESCPLAGTEVLLAVWSCVPSGLPPVCLCLAALSLLPEGDAPLPWLSPVMVLPLLQLLSCSRLTEPLAEKRAHQLNLDLAHRLLHQISKGTDKAQVIS